MTKAERAAAMSRIRKKGVKNQKRTARRSNNQGEPQPPTVGVADRKNV